MTAASPDRPAPDERDIFRKWALGRFGYLEDDISDVCKAFPCSWDAWKARAALAQSAAEHVATVCAIGSWTEIEPRNAYRPKIGDKLYAAPVAQPPAEMTRDAARWRELVANFAQPLLPPPHIMGDIACTTEYVDAEAFANAVDSRTALRAHLTAGGGR